MALMKYATSLPHLTQFVPPRPGLFNWQPTELTCSPQAPAWLSLPTALMAALASVQAPPSLLQLLVFASAPEGRAVQQERARLRTPQRRKPGCPCCVLQVGCLHNVCSWEGSGCAVHMGGGGEMDWLWGRTKVESRSWTALI